MYLRWLVAVLIIQCCWSAPFVEALEANAESQYGKLSKSAAAHLQKEEFAAAAADYRQAISIAISGHLANSAVLNTKLLLVHCLSNLKLYDAALRELKEVELALDNQCEPYLEANPAMRLRLQRRKVEMYLLMGNSKSAALEQRKLCDIYAKHIGKLVLNYFGHLTTLQRLEREAGNDDDALKTGLENEKLMQRFHLARNSALWFFLYIELGKVSFNKNQLEQASKFFRSGLSFVNNEDPPFVAHLSASLAVCARAMHDDATEKFALRKLREAFPERQKQDAWLTRANLELKTHYTFVTD